VVSEAEASPVTRVLAAYISSALRKPLPEDVLEKTKHHVLDTFAAMVSGSRLLPGRKAIAYVKSRGGVKEAGVAGSGFVTSAENAALANAMLAHSDETDDSHAPSYTHPGCGIVPAAMAMAERQDRNGRAFLRAVALGYDVGCRLTMALNAQEFREEGHATHSFGPMFGAAAAAGALARLDPTDCRYLVAYTCQQAAGVGSWTRDTEHIEKAFVFGGMSARNGVTAALMVAQGLTGEDDPLSGEHSFFTVYGRNPEPARLVDGLGARFEIMNTNIKRWSVGSPIQAPLDSLLELVRAHSIKADEVEKVVVRVDPRGARTTDDRAMPDISMQQMCAVMLSDGIVTFASSHDADRMADPALLDLRRRIELIGDEALLNSDPPRQGIVEIRLKDGREFRHHTKAVRGTADNPMTRQEVEEKCLALIAGVLGRKRARRLCKAVWDLDDLGSVRKLRPLLQK
jgi:2-methylcitrate dehydratase PrpD